MYGENWQYAIVDWMAELSADRDGMLKALEAIGKQMIKKFAEPPPEVSDDPSQYPVPTTNVIANPELWAPGKRVSLEELRKCARPCCP